MNIEGTRVAAYNFREIGAQPTTANGVLFDAFAITGNPTTRGNFEIAEDPGLLVGTKCLDFGIGPFQQLDCGLPDLAGVPARADFMDTITLSIGGLTIGNQYPFQWWNNDSFTVTNVYFTSSPTGDGVTLTGNTKDPAPFHDIRVK